MPPMCTLMILTLLSAVVVTTSQAPAKSPAISPSPAKSRAVSHSPAAPVTSPPATPTPMSPTAMAPGPDCMTQIFNMSDCLTYVEQGSNTTKPDQNCCPEFAGMLDSNPICLCSLLANSSQSPIPLDLKRAMKLPSVCGLKTPPISLCSLVGVPVAAPGPGAAVSAGTPSSSPGMSSMAPMGGNVEAPSGSKNGAQTLNSHTTLSFLISALALAALTLNTRD